MMKCIKKANRMHNNNNAISMLFVQAKQYIRGRFSAGADCFNPQFKPKKSAMLKDVKREK